MVKIRLSQTGTKNRKTYRIVATDSKKRRNGRSVEVLGFYDPLVKPAKLVLKLDRVEYWKSVGAQVTASAEKLITGYTSKA